ncbi:MAG: response regulator [Flavobacteriales bacterium]|nr:response regulator [Flavobacteriales bacterium]
MSTKTRILYLEDEPTNRMLFNYIFGNEFEVYLAKNAVEGREKMKQHEIDIAISDYLMPGENGLEFFKSIRGKHKPVRIIVSAYTEDGDIEEAVKMGAIDELVSKPYEPDELLELLRKYSLS